VGLEMLVEMLVETQAEDRLFNPMFLRRRMKKTPLPRLLLPLLLPHAVVVMSILILRMRITVRLVFLAFYYVFLHSACLSPLCHSGFFPLCPRC
jgi:hypothetical protein